MLLRALTIPHRPGPQAGEERRVPGQHAEVAFLPGHRDFVHLVRERLIGRDDVQCELRW